MAIRTQDLTSAPENVSASASSSSSDGGPYALKKKAKKGKDIEGKYQRMKMAKDSTTDSKIDGLEGKKRPRSGSLCTLTLTTMHPKW